MEVTQEVIAQNRVGCFSLPEHLLLDPEIVSIMSWMVVVRCEHLFDKRVFEYVAYSNMFKSIPRDEYNYAPVYYFARSKSTGDMVALEAAKKDVVVEYPSLAKERESRTVSIAPVAPVPANGGGADIVLEPVVEPKVAKKKPTNKPKPTSIVLDERPSGVGETVG